MNLFNLFFNQVYTLTAQVAAETPESQIVFNPMNFVANLRYMGIGMLVIFVLIGLIILTTMLVNKIFSKK
ncbi:MAG: hypothetical protein IJ333_06985 [Clostridia bacterium]|nr:hypothetical protein [Clostridia bacterium]